MASRGNEVASAARDVVGEARGARLPSFTTATKPVSGLLRGGRRRLIAFLTSVCKSDCILNPS